jgi:hypothetical protein
VDRLTRFVLWLLGWRACLGRDARGERYEAWVRRGSYFHVYHERVAWENVIRPNTPLTPQRGARRMNP